MRQGGAHAEDEHHSQARAGGHTEIAREIFKSLSQGLAAPLLADLRPTRQAKNITITAAAQALGTYPGKISRTENGTYPDYELAQRYRDWLTAA